MACMPGGGGVLACAVLGRWGCCIRSWRGFGAVMGWPSSGGSVSLRLGVWGRRCGVRMGRWGRGRWRGVGGGGGGGSGGAGGGVVDCGGCGGGVGAVGAVGDWDGECDWG